MEHHLHSRSNQPQLTYQYDAFKYMKGPTTTDDTPAIFPSPYPKDTLD